MGSVGSSTPTVRRLWKNRTMSVGPWPPMPALFQNDCGLVGQVREFTAGVFPADRHNREAPEGVSGTRGAKQGRPQGGAAGTCLPSRTGKRRHV
jgi:hypothetical protein